MTIPANILQLHSDSITHRPERWRGDSSSIPLSAFSSSDRAALESLYEHLQSLQTAFEEVGYDGEEARKIFDRFVTSGQWRVLMELAKSIQEEAQEEIDRDLFLQVRHDIRGGALTRLLCLCQFAALGMLKDQEFSQSYLRIRDQTKIMRNGIPDLDRQRYDRDSREQIHDVDLLVKKWSNPRLFDAEQIVETTVHCDFRGPISDRCVEFAALDRVVYNLMNNAIKRCAHGSIDLYITAGAQQNSSNLLIAVSNEVDEEQRQVLLKRFGGTNLAGLMNGGFTTDGNGLGLRICADFVSFAYGIRFEEVIEKGYVGARLENQNFISWVHWPVVADE